MIIDEEVYLEHHGVKGQQWGVRNVKRNIDRQIREHSPFAKRNANGKLLLARQPVSAAEAAKRRKRMIKIAVVIGSAAAIAGVLYLRSHHNVMSTKTSSFNFPKVSDARKLKAIDVGGHKGGLTTIDKIRTGQDFAHKYLLKR